MNAMDNLKLEVTEELISLIAFQKFSFSMKLCQSIKQYTLISFKSREQNCSGQFFSPFL